MELLEGYNLRQAVTDAVGTPGEYDTDWNTVKAMPLQRGQFISIACLDGGWEVVVWDRENDIAIFHEEMATAAWNAWLLWQGKQGKR